MDTYGCNEYNEFEFEHKQEYKHPTTFNMDEILHDDPHYSDYRFKKDQTIFGVEEDGLEYDYSDRFWQWNWSKVEESSKYATTKFNRRTANWYQEYLSFFFDKPVELKHIIAGVNVSTGYSYLIFGYRFLELE